MENALSVNNHKQYKGDECPPLFCVQTSQFQTRGGRRSAVGARQSARGGRSVAVGAWRPGGSAVGARGSAHGKGARRGRTAPRGAHHPLAPGRVARLRAGCRGALPRVAPAGAHFWAAAPPIGRARGWRTLAGRGPQIRARRSGPSGGQARRRTRAGPNAISSSTTRLPYVVAAAPAPARFLWHFWRAARRC